MAKLFPPVMLLTSILLFCGALAFPGFYVIQGNELPKPWIEGFWLLVLGPWALPQGIVAWLANPLLFLSWLTSARRRHGAALLFAMMALGLALSFFLHQDSDLHDGSQTSTIGQTALGYWLWIASIGTAVFAGFWARWMRSNNSFKPKPLCGSA